MHSGKETESGFFDHVVPRRSLMVLNLGPFGRFTNLRGHSQI